MAEPVAQDKQSMIDEQEAYSQTVIDHVTNPRNFGELANANGFAKATGPFGHTMAIWLKVKDDKIDEVSFVADVCVGTLAAGSMVTEMTKSKSLAQARMIDQQAILQALGGLPPDHEHCALLAASTLKQAIQNYLAFKRDPWKRAYQR